MNNAAEKAPKTKVMVVAEALPWRRRRRQSLPCRLNGCQWPKVEPILPKK